MPGVVRILTADDIPGERVLGLYAKDWPVYIRVGEITRYIGDALACVIAETEAEARAAAACVKVDYEVLTPLLDMEEAETSPIHIHENGNILLDKTIRRGEPVDGALARCAFTAEATYRTQANTPSSSPKRRWPFPKRAGCASMSSPKASGTIRRI